MTTKEDGLFVGPNDGTVLMNPIGGQMVIKAFAQDTGGYTLHENILPAGSPGPRPHIHRHHDEAFYVLEGELTMRVGARTITAPAGSFVIVPRGVVHQPSNPGAQPIRALLIFSPAGMDSFFAEAAERRIPMQLSPSNQVAQYLQAYFAQKYGFEFDEFPL